MQDVRQQMIQATVKKEDGTCALNNYQFDDERSQILLAKAIIAHEYPFNIVTHAFLQDYLHSLRPVHKIPSRTQITNLCMMIYNEGKKKLNDMFINSSIRLSLTMDKWTSSSQNISYLCITAHFVDEAWILQKRIIGFIKAHGSTGMDICNMFMSRMLEWKVDDKLLSVTVDNDKANDVALRLAKERLEKFLPCDGVFFHVRCAAHIINLIVQDGLKKISKAIEKVRLSVKYITCSPQMEESFYIIAKQVNLSTKKCLALDCCTRWNSTYLMLATALEYKSAFHRFQLKDSRYINCPSEAEWNHIETLSKCLKHFFDATELVSGTKYPTSNLLFEEFCEIDLLLNEWSRSFDDIIVDMALAMKKKFDKYWKMSNKIFAVATFLDPRFKMMIINYYYDAIYGMHGQIYINDVLYIIRKLYDEYSSKFEGPNLSDQNATQEGNFSREMISVGNKRKSRFARYIETIESAPSKTELDIYMEEGNLRWNDDLMGKFDILAWWKSNAGKYPKLSRIARDVLGIPISTVASESAFSTGGRVIHSYRSRMKTDTVEALICGQDWLKEEKAAAKMQSFMDESNVVDVDGAEEFIIPDTFIKPAVGDNMEGFESDAAEDDI